MRDPAAAPAAATPSVSANSFFISQNDMRSRELLLQMCSHFSLDDSVVAGASADREVTNVVELKKVGVADAIRKVFFFARQFELCRRCVPEAVKVAIKQEKNGNKVRYSRGKEPFEFTA